MPCVSNRVRVTILVRVEVRLEMYSDVSLHMGNTFIAFAKFCSFFFFPINRGLRHSFILGLSDCKLGRHGQYLGLIHSHTFFLGGGLLKEFMESKVIKSIF